MSDAIIETLQGLSPNLANETLDYAALSSVLKTLSGLLEQTKKLLASSTPPPPELPKESKLDSNFLLGVFLFLVGF